MAKGSGSTKSIGAGGASATRTTAPANGGGKFDYVKNHPFYMQEYVDKLKTLKPSWVMKEDGEELSVKNSNGTEIESVNRIGTGTGAADVIEYLGKRLDSGATVSYEGSIEKGTIKKSGNNYILKTEKATVRAKSVEAIYLYTDRTMGEPSFDGKVARKYYKF